MKKIIIILFLFIASFSYAQIAPFRGIILAELTTTELNALASRFKVEGSFYYDTTLNKFVTWNGSDFEVISGSGGGGNPSNAVTVNTASATQQLLLADGDGSNLAAVTAANPVGAKTFYFDFESLGSATDGFLDDVALSYANDTLTAVFDMISPLPTITRRVRIPQGSGGSLGQIASDIPFTPNGNIASTNVQAAIQEVRNEANVNNVTRGINPILESTFSLFNSLGGLGMNPNQLELGSSGLGYSAYNETSVGNDNQRLELMAESNLIANRASRISLDKDKISLRSSGAIEFELHNVAGNPVQGFVMDTIFNSDSDVVRKINLDAAIAGLGGAGVTQTILTYTTYAAEITQSGTNAPDVVNVIVNNTGLTFNWTRSSQGIYNLLPSGASYTYDEDKILTFIQNQEGTGDTRRSRIITNSGGIQVTTHNPVSGTVIDNVLNILIEVKIYP
jgi:hypothetical protein